MKKRKDICELEKEIELLKQEMAILKLNQKVVYEYHYHYDTIPANPQPQYFPSLPIHTPVDPWGNPTVICKSGTFSVSDNNFTITDGVYLTCNQ
jgi:hypothetical protein